ncbi:unnamed protein product [Cylindrotheca closterium]|uniref:BspA family leucine-rich repeat surface protein n=1 Tax=Cylindrotheca closterium TaxID=2856 RepID=A0AAD2CFH1_9STRA|nr:unnamed protein product [Cylindrotheca closterium]
MKSSIFCNCWLISLFLIGYSHADCFRDREELANAVDAYLSDGSPDTNVATRYGWPIGSWCVSNVTDFSRLFLNATEFNEDLSGWDTSRALIMHGTFEMATSFNQPLMSWNVSQTSNFRSMFLGARSFNQDLSPWDTSSCVTMKNMFMGAKDFNGDVSSWNVGNCVDMTGMLHQATSFHQDLCSWGSTIQQNVGEDIFRGTDCPMTGDPDWSDAGTTTGPFCFPCSEQLDFTDDYSSALALLSAKMLLVLILPMVIAGIMILRHRSNNRCIDPSDTKLTEFELLQLDEEEGK